MRITNAVYDVIHFLLKNTGKASSYFWYFAIVNRAYFHRKEKIPDKPIKPKES